MKLSLNLASRRYVNERAFKRGFQLLLLLLLLLLAFQLWIFVQSRKQIGSYQINIGELELQLRGAVTKLLTAEQISKYEQDFRQASALIKKDAFRWTALFDRLEILLPNDVSIRSFNPNYKSGSLVFNGVAKDLAALQKLLDNLHGDSFRQVFLQNQDQVDVAGYGGEKLPAISFSIKLEGVF